jgi:uncharacterized protein with PIN domain
MFENILAKAIPKDVQDRIEKAMREHKDKCPTCRQHIEDITVDVFLKLNLEYTDEISSETKRELERAVKTHYLHCRECKNHAKNVTKEAIMKKGDKYDKKSEAGMESLQPENTQEAEQKTIQNKEISCRT